MSGHCAKCGNAMCICKEMTQLADSIGSGPAREWILSGTCDPFANSTMPLCSFHHELKCLESVPVIEKSAYDAVCAKLEAEMSAIVTRAHEIQDELNADIAVLGHQRDEARRERDDLRTQLAEAHIRIEQHRGALGYPVAVDIPQDMSLQCGMCTAKASECKEWKDEYFNVSKFATDYEYQRDDLRALVRELWTGLSDLAEEMKWRIDKDWNEHTPMPDEWHEAHTLLEKAKGSL